MNSTANTPRPAWWRVRVSPARQFAGLLLLALAGLFFYAMLAKGLRFFVVDSGSMVPTVWPGDRLVAIRETEYRRGDIVIVRDPFEEKAYLVKRLIGVAGDTVEIRGGAVFLNGQYLSEPYRPEPIDYTIAPYTVPPDSVFVLGDNSNKSLDSHNWPSASSGGRPGIPKALPAQSVIARAVFQYYPFSRLGPVRHFSLYNPDHRPSARTAGAPPLQ